MSSTAARASEVTHVVATLIIRSMYLPAAVSWTSMLFVRSKTDSLVNEQADWSSTISLEAEARSDGVRTPASWSWWMRKVSVMAKPHGARSWLISLSDAVWLDTS